MSAEGEGYRGPLLIPPPPPGPIVTVPSSCVSIPMNRTSLVAVGIVGGSLTLIVSNYDPDLTMLLATVLLLAFGIVTPAQGTALRLSQQHLALQALHALPSVLPVPA